MTDPISVISLVASIVTLVDFGYKVVSGGKSARGSNQGTLPNVTRLDAIVNEIHESNVITIAQLSGSQMPTKAERNVMGMVKESEVLYTQLHNTITKLTMRPEARFKHLESSRVAFQSLLSQKDLEELEKRLRRLDRRIRSEIQSMIGLKQHSAVITKLQELQDEQQALGIDYESKYRQIRRSIIDLTARTEQRYDTQIAHHDTQLMCLKARLDDLVKDHSDSLRYVRVIRSLYFREVRRRFDQISPTHLSSSEWIYDPALTSFTAWLEDKALENDTFYIWGKAGSGKSTLMKYISEHSRTKDSLNHWAGTKKLHTASYFFWNQGTEMQKSRSGLMQSILYQILRSAPDLIPQSTETRLHHEAWDVEEMIEVFNHIAAQTELSSKFCFFIDGLDEYNGDESDIEPMLQVLTASSHIKVCVSSRPGRIYESALRSKHTFNIAQFTKEDMKEYVETRLTANPKFVRLADLDPQCDNVISDISVYAQGVWLWVFLVTRDILYELNRDEGISTILKIVNEFPSDLEKYFERIIGRIKDRHKEEMAQTFLVTIHEVQPLPLFAFALLEEERTNPDFALMAPIQPVSDEVFSSQYSVWSSRVQNRCGDLLIVDPSPHPIFLSHSVDFLHRTVRDFLRDCYHNELRSQLKADFDPLVSLCRICLSLLKALPIDDIRNRDSINRVIGLTDELLYYAHEIEKSCLSQSQNNVTLNALLDEVDVVNCHHARGITKHWTHARDSPIGTGYDIYKEGGQCTFLALAVQARLCKYTDAKLQSEPHLMAQKRGRPLLDYALRPRRCTPLSMDFHSSRDDPNVDPNMVRMLLAHGANPNQPVNLYDGQTVWSLFLISMYELSNRESSTNSIHNTLKSAWYSSCEALIAAGASTWKNTFSQYHDGLTVYVLLTRVFGADRAQRLQDQIEAVAAENERERRSGQAYNFCTVM